MRRTPVYYKGPLLPFQIHYMLAKAAAHFRRFVKCYFENSAKKFRSPWADRERKCTVLSRDMPGHYEGENSQFGNKKLAAYSIYTANYTHYALILLTLGTVLLTPFFQ